MTDKFKLSFLVVLSLLILSVVVVYNYGKVDLKMDIKDKMSLNLKLDK